MLLSPTVIVAVFSSLSTSKSSLKVMVVSTSSPSSWNGTIMLFVVEAFTVTVDAVLFTVPSFTR
jgi:predicted permease